MFYVELFILGLPIAGLFALLGLGIVSIYRATRILNLAHGAMAMFTAYVLYWLARAPSGPTLPLPIAVVLALVFAGLQGWALERFMLRPLRGRPVLTSVIMTVGALAFLTAFAGYLWGYDRQDAPSILPGGRTVSILGATLSIDRLLILVICAALVLAVVALFKRTTFGIAMRAVADDPDAAVLMGIPATRISQITWAGGSILAGIAGILLSPIIGLQPINLTLLAIPAYAAALFGGLSSLPMTLIGAGIIGVAYAVIPALPIVASSGFPGARELVIFGSVIVFLFVRWQQLFGSSLDEEVA